MKMEILPDKLHHVPPDAHEPLDPDLERLIDLVERIGEGEEDPR